MVVLAAPTPPTMYVRYALLLNGVLMLTWAPRVIEGKGVIRWAEGPRAVEKKTPFDLMIWRICGIWVACVGATCLQVGYIMGSEKTPFFTKLAHALAMQIAIVHFVETFIKYKAVGRRVGLAASGNITLGSFLVIALLIDTSNFSRAWFLILPAIMVGLFEFYGGDDQPFKDE